MADTEGVRPSSLADPDLATADLGVDPRLPIAAHADQIAALIRDHQVVVVAGETGSGKTTQLPKICLALGRGAIAHTQPRRIAARNVSARVAQEMGVRLGGAVGYQVRLARQTSARTRLTVMTDGILLAEIGHDRELRRYDTIIVDEAHERSLNIDFLLGYLKQLLPRRRDLKVVVTSATIDTARFAAYFDDAPIVQVEGRTFPVEVRYRPIEADGESADQCDAIVAGVRELRQEGRGDVLVFLAGEREIRDATDALRAAGFPDVELMPLYARLTADEQQRVFTAHPGQRIVLATNVAETSLTVPGVRYVIDPGFARISRFSGRTKVQRLPIEAISRASADQRAGRCGRVAPGVCLRLYSEDDYLSRPEFTQPEILRTNLASVILQMAQAGLGDITRFDFLDAPDAAQIADGFRLLIELGAISAQGRSGSRTRAVLTPIGRQLARLPVDPRLARILVEGAKRGCLREALVLAAGFSLQDVRERPLEQRAQADQMHARFASDQALAASQASAASAHTDGAPARYTPHTGHKTDAAPPAPDPGGDVAVLLRLWSYLQDRRRATSGNQFRRQCRAEFLNYLRVREWQDLVAQLRDACAELGLHTTRGPAPISAVLTAVLSGYLSQIGLLEAAPARVKPQTSHGRPARRGPREYLGTRGARFALSPASVLARHPPQLVMAVDLVETTRLWAHQAAGIEPEWVEAVGQHLLKRAYASPHFSSDTGHVVAYETVTLLGVPLVSGRLAGYEDVDPDRARELFIRQGLVEREWAPAPGSPARAAIEHNQAVWDELEELEDRVRRRALDDQQLYDFYQARLPVAVASTPALEAWLREDPDRARLIMLREDDLALADGPDVGGFPDSWTVAGLELPVSYVFSPGDERDGVVVEVALAQLGALPAEPFTWQVPGLRHDAATELIRTLPKAVRAHFVPAPDWSARALAWLDDHGGDHDRALADELARALLALTGEQAGADSWRADAVPPALRVGFSVVDHDAEIGFGKDLAALQAQFAPKVEATLTKAATSKRKHRPTRSAATWVFADLPESLDLGGGVTGYPGLRDDVTRVSEVVWPTPGQRRVEQRKAVLRLLGLTLPDPSTYAVAYLSNEDRLALGASPYPDSASLWADARAKAIEQLADRFADPGQVRAQADFEALSVQVRQRLADQQRGVVAQTAETLRGAHELRVALAGMPAGHPAARDVAAQLDDLVFPGFIRFTRDPWFAYLPRYLRAARLRLDAAAQDPARDQTRQAEVDDVLDDYQRLLDAQPAGPVPPDVDDVAFLIEELRIQIFAQQLGTHVQVSPKRVHKAIQAFRDTGTQRPI